MHSIIVSVGAWEHVCEYIDQKVTLVKESGKQFGFCCKGVEMGWSWVGRSGLVCFELLSFLFTRKRKPEI